MVPRSTIPQPFRSRRDRELNPSCSSGESPANLTFRNRKSPGIGAARQKAGTGGSNPVPSSGEVRCEPALTRVTFLGPGGGGVRPLLAPDGLHFRIDGCSPARRWAKFNVSRR